MIEVVVGLDQVQELVPIGRKGIRANTSDVYMAKEQTSFKVLATDTYNNLNRINLVDKTIVGHLNL